MTMPAAAPSAATRCATAGVGSGPVSAVSMPAATRPASIADSTM